MTDSERLAAHFKEVGTSVEVVAEKTGYKPGYIRQLFWGLDPLTDSARFKFIKAFPETAAFLLAGAGGEPACPQCDGPIYPDPHRPGAFYCDHCQEAVRFEMGSGR
jgi:hypothetical protein